MMKHGNRYYHHSTNLEGMCNICNKHFKQYWEDASELNGFSDTTSKLNGAEVHYFCIPGARSLQQINEERKLLKIKNLR